MEMKDEVDEGVFDAAECDVPFPMPSTAHKRLSGTLLVLSVLFIGLSTVCVFWW